MTLEDRRLMWMAFRRALLLWVFIFLGYFLYVDQEAARHRRPPTALDEEISHQNYVRDRQELHDAIHGGGKYLPPRDDVPDVF